MLGGEREFNVMEQPRQFEELQYVDVEMSDTQRSTAGMMLMEFSGRELWLRKQMRLKAYQWKWTDKLAGTIAERSDF